MDSKDLSRNDEELLNQLKIKSRFEMIKSKIILQKILNNLTKPKSMEIIKYNKSIQQKLELNIIDFKECCEKYSSIEIEIIPVENKYGPFININENEEKYYHIYFNNNKNEIKRTNINKVDKVSKIKIIINYHIKSFKDLFFPIKKNELIFF